MAGPGRGRGRGRSKQDKNSVPTPRHEPSAQLPAFQSLLQTQASEPSSYQEAFQQQGRGKQVGNTGVTPRLEPPSQLPAFQSLSGTQASEASSQQGVFQEEETTLQTGNTSAGNWGNIRTKKGRGKYKSLHVDMKTKYGSKIPITIPDDILRAVGEGSRDIVNYCGLIMRNTVSFRDGGWSKIILIHGEAMWLKVKDKFAAIGMREHKMQGLMVQTMQRQFRNWKARLHAEYLQYTTDEERLSHRPDDVTPEDWVFLLKHFASKNFKDSSERNKKNREKQVTKHSCGSKSFAEVEESTRNPISGQKETPDEVWKLQHSHTNDKNEVIWSDPKSKEIYGQLQEIVAQQQCEGNEHPMSGDEILVTVLGEKSSYFREKGYGKQTTKKVVCSR